MPEKIEYDDDEELFNSLLVPRQPCARTGDDLSALLRAAA
jgi:hypothetical protein